MRLFNSRREPLFQPLKLSKLITDQNAKLTSHVEAFTDDEILTIPIDDMVDAIYENVYVPPLNIDYNGISQTPRHVNRMLDQSGATIDIDAFVFEVEFRYTGASGLFRHSPTSRDDDPPKAELNQGSYEGSLKISVFGENLTADVVKAEIEKELVKFERYIAYQGRELDPFNTSLRDNIGAQISSRKDKILNARNISASLGYPMIRREGAPTTYISPVVRRKISKITGDV